LGLGLFRSPSVCFLENCFFDIDNFTVTQENYSTTPAVVNYRWANRQQLTAAGASGS